MEEKGYKEFTSYTDIKIVIFAIACAIGYYSHFKCKFPADYLIVVAAVCAYAFLMAIHYYIENFLEKDAFFISKSHEVSVWQCPDIVCSMPSSRHSRG